MPKMACGLFVLILFLPTAHADLIVNGGFETGDFTGWSQSGWLIDTTNPNSGVYDASTGCSGVSCTTVADPNAAYLYQNVATAVGTTYTLSFFYNSGQLATTASELLVLWGDPSAPNLSTVVDFVNVGTSVAYVQYTGAIAATSEVSQLEFLGRQDLDFYSLDDVSLNAPVSSVPEPGSLLLLVAGAYCLALSATKRQRPISSLPQYDFSKAGGQEIPSSKAPLCCVSQRQPELSERRQLTKPICCEQSRQFLASPTSYLRVSIFHFP